MAATNVLSCNVRVYQNTQKILGQRGASLSFDADMADVTVTPDSGAVKIKEYLPSMTSWSVSMKGVVMTGGASGFGTLLAYMNSATPTALTLKMEIGATSEFVSGTGYVKSLKMSADSLSSEATWDMEIQGTGALTPTLASA